MFKPRQKNYNNDSSFAVNGLLSHRSAMTVSKKKEKKEEENWHLKITQKNCAMHKSVTGFSFAFPSYFKKKKKEKLWQKKK